jgi:hypothetical protein
MTYSTGDRVAHTQYGDGTLVSANEYHTVIDFDAHGRKTFSSPRVVLTRSLVPAPPKPVRRTRAARTASAAAAEPATTKP